MSQLILPGFDAPLSAPTHRLFFAAMPEPDVAARIAELAAQLRADLHVKAKPLQAERLHVTLHHLGDFPYMPAVMTERACLAAASLDVHSFDVEFDQVCSFKGRPGHRPWALTGSAGLDALSDFQRTLGDALDGAGLHVSRLRFVPHLTLLYGEGKLAPRPIGPIAWTVREFVLIDSWLGKTRYDVKRRWPLSGADPSSA